MAPAKVRASIFRIWIRLYGVSRMHRINCLLSFRITSAALVIKSLDKPLAILPIVPMEQGMITICSNFADPEAKGAMKS